MTYVVTTCIMRKYMTCVEVCPSIVHVVSENMLVINPSEYRLRRLRARSARLPCPIPRAVRNSGSS
jgi:hypothetical protein